MNLPSLLSNPINDRYSAGRESMNIMGSNFSLRPCKQVINL